MRKYAQIMNGRVWSIFEAEEKPDFAPSILLVDITGQDDIQERWYYNAASGAFSEEPFTDGQPTNEELLENQTAIMLALADMYAAIMAIPTQGGTPS